MKAGLPAMWTVFKVQRPVGDEFTVGRDRAEFLRLLAGAQLRRIDRGLLTACSQMNSGASAPKASSSPTGRCISSTDRMARNPAFT